MNYKERLQIPIEGNETTIFKTKSGTKVATGYTRIVIGGRGPYIEFSPEQFCPNMPNIFIPEEEVRRQRDKNNIFYYWEYRTKDDSRIKIYYQKKLVDYADYKIDMFYISPFDLLADDKVIIEKLVREASPIKENPQLELF